MGTQETTWALAASLQLHHKAKGPETSAEIWLMSSSTDKCQIALVERPSGYRRAHSYTEKSLPQADHHRCITLYRLRTGDCALATRASAACPQE